MDCKTAARNKRKMMQKIMGNNRRLSTPATNKEFSEDNTRKIDDVMAKEPSADSSDGVAAAQNPLGKIDTATTYEGTTEKQQTAPGSMNSTLPDEAPYSGRPKDHVSQEKTTAYVISEEEYVLPLDDVNSPFYAVNHVIERLDSPDMNGCIIMLAARCDSYFGVVPLAGGVIEIYDEHERSIQAIWVNRNLEQRADVHILLKTLVLRIFAHAYQIQLPDKRVTKSNKLVSIYQSMLATFPRECFSFIEKDMLLSKHYEAAGFNEPHNDNPKVPCRCHKVAHQASEMFYGISESRFNNLYSNLYEQMLFESIGRMAPVAKMYPPGSFTHSEKMDQIAKAVREIERSLKDQGTNKRPRKA